MNVEIIMIENILTSIKQPFTVKQLGQAFRKKYKHKISNKVLQNYLWSYFRSEIEYKPETYEYSLKSLSSNIGSTFDFDIDVVSDAVRPLSVSVKNDVVRIALLDAITVQDLVKAFYHYHLNYAQQAKNFDFIKKINQIIEREK